MSTPATSLAPDLEQALKRLKLRAVRKMAPEVLQIAKVQRWAPEELLRTLVEAEVRSRDEANERARLARAAFPVRKTLAEFKVAESAVPRATFEYLASLEWIRAKENLVLVGPAGTGKSHLLVALGHAAVEAGLRVRYFGAIELVETVYRGLADNSVGRIIESSDPPAAAADAVGELELGLDARRAVRAAASGVDGLDHVGQDLVLQRAQGLRPGPTGVEAAPADAEDAGHRGDVEAGLLSFREPVHRHRVRAVSPTNKADAFTKISRSSVSTRTWRRRRASSSRSLVVRPSVRRPASRSARFTHSRKAFAETPRS